MSIDEGNDLIAVWMSKQLTHPNDRRWHKDWNCLMEAVDKVQRTLYNLWETYQITERVQMEVNINTNFVTFVDKETGWYILDPIKGESLIEAVFTAICNFIQWYNQQNIKS